MSRMKKSRKCFPHIKVTSEVIPNFMKNGRNLRLHIDSIHINIYQNRALNECVRKNLAKIQEVRNFGIAEITERRSFFCEM